MKILVTLIFSFSITVACNNKPADEKGLNKDTMEAVPGYGAGQESGTGSTHSPSYPKPAIVEDEKDTSRGIHGVNIDTTGTGARK